MKHKLLVFLVSLGMICINASIDEDFIQLTTGDNYTYEIIPSLTPIYRICGEIVFELKTAKNAFVALLSGSSEDTLQYEIAIGVGGYYSFIRAGKGLLNLTNFIRDYESGFEADTLIRMSISWNNDNITLERKSHPSWSLDAPGQPPIIVESFAVASSEVTAFWNFTSRVMIPDGCDIHSTESITTSAEDLTTTTGNSNQVTGNQVCSCPCSDVGENKWQFLDNYNLTIDEIKFLMKDELESLKRNLTIDKKDTSAYLRTKTSAVDNRPVSRSIGTLGVVMLVAVAVLLMGSDFVSVINSFKNWFKRKDKMI